MQTLRCHLSGQAVSPASPSQRVRPSYVVEFARKDQPRQRQFWQWSDQMTWSAVQQDI